MCGISLAAISLSFQAHGDLCCGWSQKFSQFANAIRSRLSVRPLAECPLVWQQQCWEQVSIGLHNQVVKTALMARQLLVNGLLGGVTRPQNRERDPTFFDLLLEHFQLFIQPL